ncbi:MAG: EAL domain-containing protein [Pontibacterium sp.]
MLSAHQQVSGASEKLLLIDSHNICSDQLNMLCGPEMRRTLHHCSTFSEASSLQDLSFNVLLLAVPAVDNRTFHTLRKAVERWPRLPVIVLAPQIEVSHEQGLIKSGASDFISLQSANQESLQRSLRYSLESQKRNEEINRLRHSDPLTSLGNRRDFYQNALHLLNNARNTHLRHALLTVDLDGFRKFNTQHGHQTGDQVVLQLCHRLIHALKEGDLIARLEADEFAIMLECQAHEDLESQTKARVQAILLETSAPYLLDKRSAILPCSIGIAYSAGESLELDEMMRRAGVARLQAKQRHPCTYQVYNPSVDARQSLADELEPELAGALRKNQFELFFQPRIDLKTGKIAGAETLARWLHPSRGLIMPGEFITLCEQNGMIIPMGYWAIHRAGIQLNALHNAGYSHCRVSVNLSFCQFQDSKLVATIDRIIQKNKINSAYLELELTESVLISDEQHVSDCLQKLSNLSIEFSLDDFGTGYSSFALLQKLPISTLKIDRSFIRNVTTNPDDAEIVRTMINLAHSLGKKVIAEGVETQDQLAFLSDHGCDQVQGYLFSPPVPFNDFIQMLEQE